MKGEVVSSSYWTMRSPQIADSRRNELALQHLGYKSPPKTVPSSTVLRQVYQQLTYYVENTLIICQ